MNQQLCIDFEPRRLARRSNPETSHVAAARTGEFSSGHHARILQALQYHGPCTYHEAAEHCGLEPHAAGKRFRELEVAGLIAVVKAFGKDQTRPSPSGRPARVWFLVAAA